MKGKNVEPRIQSVRYGISMLRSDNLFLAATMISGISVAGVGHLHSIH